eukprot:5167459-Pyramimonas_sp.AAC.1
MVTAQYMIEEGGKVLSLLSRSGRPAADVADIWERLQSTSATVLSRACDISSMDAVRELAAAMAADGAKRSPATAAGGVVHLAAVLDDATLPKLTRAHLEKSYGAK